MDECHGLGEGGIVEKMCEKKEKKKNTRDLGCFIVLEARTHYLLPCRKSALESINEKNGSKNKIDTQIALIF